MDPASVAAIVVGLTTAGASIAVELVRRLRERQMAKPPRAKPPHEHTRYDNAQDALRLHIMRRLRDDKCDLNIILDHVIQNMHRVRDPVLRQICVEYVEIKLREPGGDVHHLAQKIYNMERAPPP